MTFDQYLTSYSSIFGNSSLLALGVSFIAGLLSSSVCPCTVPMGVGVVGLVNTSEDKKSGMLIGLSFFFGLLSSFLLFSLISAKLSLMLSESFGVSWSLVMAIFSLVAAVMAFYGPRFKTKTFKALQKPGLVGAFIYGIIFSVGTSVAPLLLLLGVSSVNGGSQFGLMLSFFFGLGKGLPFLAIALFAGTLAKLTKLENGSALIRYVSSIGLIFVSGYYFLTFYNLLQY